MERLLAALFMEPDTRKEEKEEREEVMGGFSRKTDKLMNWMVFGSKKILSKKYRDLPEANKNHRVTPRDMDVPKPLCMMNPFRFKAKSVLGRGGYGKVILVFSHDLMRYVAVKEVIKANLVETDEDIRMNFSRSATTKVEYMEMESLILQTVSRHPFITGFFGAFQTNQKAFLCMEFCSGGDLFQHMTQTPFSESRTKLYVAEIACALEFLHDQNIIYRDLKPENVLMDSKGHVRIADFGLAIKFNSDLEEDMRCQSVCGTPEYIAPEIVLMGMKRNYEKKLTYGKCVDWWALGVITFEMLFKVPPFYDNDRKSMMNKILMCDVKIPIHSKIRPPSDAAQNFILSLLQFNEKDRLGYGRLGSINVRSHPFLSSLDYDTVLNKEYDPEFVPMFTDLADTCYFDPIFTNEVLRDDKLGATSCDMNLRGFDVLADNFSSSRWY